MASQILWTDPEGLETIRRVVSKRIPDWKQGLRPFQEQPITLILNGEDLLLCTATGDGKSALFTVPILCHLEVSSLPDSYPKLPVCKYPVGLIVTPTKGLAFNIVSQLKAYGISALSYCHETLTEASKSGRNLVKEIASCEMYQVICVDPEHLIGGDWMTITDSDVFRENIVYACVEEIHLTDEWGSSFRPAFKHIGAFLRGRLPSHISIFGLSATLQPGASTSSICRSLGFRDGSFHLIRRSNERPNIQFNLEVLQHGISSDDFPQILSFLSSGRKAIIHCPTIDIIYRVYLYLWRMEPLGVNHFRRVRMYHSLNSDEYNQKSLDLLDSDPMLLVVIASVAFANGINVKSLLDSISFTFPKTLDQAWQQEGRVGRVMEDLCRGIILVQKSDIQKAEKFIAAHGSNFAPTKSKSRSANIDMDLAKALLLIEKICYIAAINRIFRNPPLDETTQDCVQANRRLICSLCSSRYNKSVSFPIPINASPFIPLPPKAVATSSTKAQKLTKKERISTESTLNQFGDDLFRSERYVDEYRPRSSYFPHLLIVHILDNLFRISTENDLTNILINQHWAFQDSYAAGLFTVIVSLQTSITNNRKRKRQSSNKRKAPSPIPIDDHSDTADDSIHPLSVTPVSVAQPPRLKRNALEDISNQPAQKRTTRSRKGVDCTSVKDIMASFGPARTKRQR
ncbi:P-loop containing nucleoside triphosphate hydrolase protein [Armillaria solidipes]|uniref:DNA 3'-5' helicase n=1 Tax=Armillaria solidipes TaxID=1076256 RepID=A0A2H3BCV2_9AGAR|nr:P-loop containing nucleoside triphosphate hydrolase protein [Armillaria solidipes]